MLDPIEAKLVEEDTLDAWAVYADRLLEAGEAWAPVVAAGCGGAPDEAAQDAAAREILGRAPDRGSITWRFGMIDALVLDDVGWEYDPNTAIAQVLRRAFAHPAGRFVGSLDLGLPLPERDIEWNFDAEIAAITETGVHPRLKSIDMSRQANHMDQPSWRRVGDLGGLWAVCPRLERLKVFGSLGSDQDGPQLVLGDIDAPALQSLVLQSSGLDVTALHDLTRASLPALVHLELWFGMDDYGNSCTLEDVRALLAHDGFPTLRRLHLDNSEWQDELVEVAAQSPLLPQLEELSLSLGVLGDGPAERLLHHAERFRHLKHLHLHENYLTEAQIQSIRQRIPGARADDQKTGDDWVYVSCGE